MAEFSQARFRCGVMLLLFNYSWCTSLFFTLFSMSIGFSMTSSGETLNGPAKSGIFLSKRRGAKSKVQTHH